MSSIEDAARDAAIEDGVLINNSDVNGILPNTVKVPIPTSAAEETSGGDNNSEIDTQKGSKAKVGLRRGKWTTEEEAYTNRLINEFKLGLLPLTDGTTLRTFLSKLLNCDPMRISKKFVGGNCIGKQVFKRQRQELEKLTPEQMERNRAELAELERNFLERVAQTNRIKTGEGPKEGSKINGVFCSDGEGGVANTQGLAGLGRMGMVSLTKVPPWLAPPDTHPATDPGAYDYSRSSSSAIAACNGMPLLTRSTADGSVAGLAVGGSPRKAAPVGGKGTQSSVAVGHKRPAAGDHQSLLSTFPQQHNHQQPLLMHPFGGFPFAPTSHAMAAAAILQNGPGTDFPKVQVGGARMNINNNGTNSTNNDNNPAIMTRTMLQPHRSPLYAPFLISQQQQQQQQELLLQQQRVLHIGESSMVDSGYGVATQGSKRSKFSRPRKRSGGSGDTTASDVSPATTGTAGAIGTGQQFASTLVSNVSSFDLQYQPLLWQQQQQQHQQQPFSLNALGQSSPPMGPMASYGQQSAQLGFYGFGGQAQRIDSFDNFGSLVSQLGEGMPSAGNDAVGGMMRTRNSKGLSQADLLAAVTMVDLNPPTMMNAFGGGQGSHQQSSLRMRGNDGGTEVVAQSIHPYGQGEESFPWRIKMDSESSSSSSAGSSMVGTAPANKNARLSSQSPSLHSVTASAATATVGVVPPGVALSGSSPRQTFSIRQFPKAACDGTSVQVDFSRNSVGNCSSTDLLSSKNRLGSFTLSLSDFSYLLSNSNSRSSNNISSSLNLPTPGYSTTDLYDADVGGIAMEAESSSTQLNVGGDTSGAEAGSPHKARAAAGSRFFMGTHSSAPTVTSSQSNGDIATTPAAVAAPSVEFSGGVDRSSAQDVGSDKDATETDASTSSTRIADSSSENPQSAGNKLTCVGMFSGLHSLSNAALDQLAAMESVTDSPRARVVKSTSSPHHVPHACSSVIPHRNTDKEVGASSAAGDGRGSASEPSQRLMANNSSLDNFWMLVNNGDIPQPAVDTLRSSVLGAAASRQQPQQKKQERETMAGAVAAGSQSSKYTDPGIIPSSSEN